LAEQLEQQMAREKEKKETLAQKAEK